MTGTMTGAALDVHARSTHAAAIKASVKLSLAQRRPRAARNVASSGATSPTSRWVDRGVRPLAGAVDPS